MDTEHLAVPDEPHVIIGRWVSSFSGVVVLQNWQYAA